MLKHFFFIITILLFFTSCNPPKTQDGKVRKITRVIEQLNDSNHIWKKYILEDSTLVSKHHYPKSPINKFIGGTFNIKYTNDTNNRWVYTASSNDSIFYKIESYCENENRFFIRHGKDLIFMEQLIKDSILNHQLYLVNPYFFDSVLISTFRHIGDSVKYNTKDYHLKSNMFSIKNKDTTDLFLVINQFPKCCEINFSDTILLKSKRLLTPK
jgi:hypothetical protein